MITLNAVLRDVKVNPKMVRREGSIPAVFYGSGITAMFIVLPRIGITSDTGVLNFEPIAALFMGWVLLGQSLSLLQGLGAVIVIGAIIVLGMAKR